MEGKCPVEFESMFFVGKYLHGLSKTGDLYAFYVYQPLESAYRDKYVIPFASNWENYSRDVALHYLPVPSGIKVFGSDLSSKVTSQSRTGDDKFPGDKVRSWEQSVFQGWPLYFMQDNPQIEHVERPLEFWLAETALGTPIAYYGDTASDDGDVGAPDAPGPFIGP